MKTATASNQRADLVGGYLSTQEVADSLRVRRQTVAKALCLNGHYLGMKPVKLPNGRLLWNADDLERLTKADS